MIAATAAVMSSRTLTTHGSAAFSAVEPREADDDPDSRKAELNGSQPQKGEAVDVRVDLPADEIRGDGEHEHRHGSLPAKHEEALAGQSMNLARCSGVGTGQLS